MQKLQKAEQQETGQTWKEFVEEEKRRRATFPAESPCRYYMLISRYPKAYECGKRHYGDGLYQKAAALLGYDQGSLRNLKTIADTFELSLRNDKVGWNHHREVASLKQVAEAEDGKLTIAAFDRGEIELPELGAKANNVELFEGPTSARQFTKLQIARFLGRTRKDGKEGRDKSIPIGLGKLHQTTRRRFSIPRRLGIESPSGLTSANLTHRLCGRVKYRPDFLALILGRLVRPFFLLCGQDKR